MQCGGVQEGKEMYEWSFWGMKGCECRRKDLCWCGQASLPWMKAFFDMLRRRERRWIKRNKGTRASKVPDLAHRHQIWNRWKCSAALFERWMFQKVVTSDLQPKVSKMRLIGNTTRHIFTPRQHTNKHTDLMPEFPSHSATPHQRVVRAHTP